MARPFVIVTWIDASDIESANGQAWFDEMELGKFAEERVVVKSAGWVWSDTKLYLTLVADDIIEGMKKPTYGRITKIPKGMIVARVDLPIDTGEGAQEQHQQGYPDSPATMPHESLEAHGHDDSIPAAIPAIPQIPATSPADFEGK